MLSRELPIYHKTFELVKEILFITGQYPKLYKYSLGEQLCKYASQLFILIQQANRSMDLKNKGNILKNYLIMFETIESLLQLSYELHCINSKKYSQLIRLCDNIGKQATGWKNYCGV